MSGYIALTRQSGLTHEMQSIANNVANLATTGYRKEGVVFTEYVHKLGRREGSVSMAWADARHIDTAQGGMTRTGGTFDFAIEGDGFFQIETPEGTALTRAGSFTPNAAGELVTPDGYRLLDAGGAPVFAPPDAQSISLSADGTLSADGRPLTQIGLVEPLNPGDLSHRAGTRFLVQNGTQPVEDGRLLQGFLENSNVNPVTEITRMIEVQRAYELGAGFLEREGDRLRSVLQTLGR